MRGSAPASRVSPTRHAAHACAPWRRAEHRQGSLKAGVLPAARVWRCTSAAVQTDQRRAPQGSAEGWLRRLASRPLTPFGMMRKSWRPPRFWVELNTAWSVPTSCSMPPAAAACSAAWCSLRQRGTGGGGVDACPAEDAWVGAWPDVRRGVAGSAGNPHGPEHGRVPLDRSNQAGGRIMQPAVRQGAHCSASWRKDQGSAGRCGRIKLSDARSLTNRPPHSARRSLAADGRAHHKLGGSVEIRVPQCALVPGKGGRHSLPHHTKAALPAAGGAHIRYEADRRVACQISHCMAPSMRSERTGPPPKSAHSSITPRLMLQRHSKQDKAIT